MSNAVLAELLRLPIGEAIGRGHLERLAALGVIERHEQGREVFHEGESADVLRIIIDGRIALELGPQGQPPTVVTALSSGDLLGWSALLGRGHSAAEWTATARATKTTHCLAFPGPGLRSLCELDHELGFYVMQHAFEVVAQRLVDARVNLLDLYGGR